MAHNLPIKKIDAALAFTRGNFVAAAKLLDLTPLQLKSIAQYRPLLHKWRKKTPGRPPERLGFTIEPFCPPPPAMSSREILQEARLLKLIEQLGKDRAREVLEAAVESMSPASLKPTEKGML